MKLLGFEIFRKNIKSEIKLEPKAFVFNESWSGLNLTPITFNGEKTPYELGNPLDFKLDYYSLRMRAWEAYIMSDIVQNAIRKYCLWIVGSGLKLQSNPILSVLKRYKVDIDQQILKEYIENVESQFRLYANTKQSVYSKEYNLHDEAVESLKNALLAGDILCISRYDGLRTSIETIDGKNIQTPLMSNYINEATKRDNIIKQGIEIDKTGAHVAYYIAQQDFTYKKILAYGSKSGKRQAWLMYGLKHKKSDVRGMSLLTAVLETASNMDRYKDATLKAAEENAKIPYTIEHKQFSDGENPLVQNIATSFGKGKGVAPETATDVAEAKATKIAQSTAKQTYNMPLGAEFKRHAGSSDSNFRDYFSINIDMVYATLGIPPEVAMDKFGGAYSGSRAAIKSWEYKIMVDREIILKRQFYKPFFDFWLDIAILNLTIQAPGYLQAIQEKNHMILESYRNCRFIGSTVPHIDPVKEVAAERLKLGKALENIPLSSIEQSMENLNTGDYDQIINQVSEEYDLAEKFTSIKTGNNFNT